MLQRNKLKRITAWITMVAVVFVMLFSEIYITQHADHDCTGADCPICAVMEQCANNIKSLGMIVAVIIAAFFLCLSTQTGRKYAITIGPDWSLVSQKVRMNN